MASTSPPISLAELGNVNSIYLATCRQPCDSTLVWGTYFELTRLDAFLTSYQQNATVLVSLSHILLRAVALAISRHPEFNRRVRGRRVYANSGIHLLMPMLRSRGGEVDTILFQNANLMSLEALATQLWEAMEAAKVADRLLKEKGTGYTFRGWWDGVWRRLNFHFSPLAFALANRFRLPTTEWTAPIQESSAMVNCLIFPQSPPLTFFKPSTLPMNAAPVHIAIGPTQPQVLVENGEPVVRRTAPLFVKADHRLVDTSRLAAFVGTLRELLHNPEQLV